MLLIDCEIIFRPLLPKLVLDKFIEISEHFGWERTCWIIYIESPSLLRFKPYSDDKFICFKLYIPTSLVERSLAPFGDMFMLISESVSNTLQLAINSANNLTPSSPIGF